MKKLFFLFSSLLTIALFNTSSAQDTTSAQKMDPAAAKHFNKGVLSLKAENYADALVSLDSSLQISKSPRTYILKAQALIKLQKQTEAKEAFKSAIEMDAKSDVAYNGLANLQLSLKEYDDAEASFKKVIEVTQDEALKISAEGSIEFITKAKAIELYNAGNELNKAGKFDEAIANYDKSLAIYKDYKTYFQKGLALSKAAKNKEAAAEFANAISANSSFDMAYIALAGIQTADKDYENAIKNYEQAQKVTTNDKIKASAQEALSRTYFAMGNAELKGKDKDKAIEYFSKSAEISAYDQAYVSLSKVYTEKKQYDQAIEALEKAKANKKTVTDGAIAYYEGQIYKAKGDLKKAAESFTAAQSDPKFKKAAASELANMKAKGAKK